MANYQVDISNIIKAVIADPADLEEATRREVSYYYDTHSSYDNYCLLKEAFRYDAGNTPRVKNILFYIKSELVDRKEQERGN